MPLLDHFHPPLSTQRHWESFHTTWAGSIADALNQQWLPEGYFAEEQLQPPADAGNGGWHPRGLEIHVFAGGDGPAPIGAIELVSPANKDRPATRRAFAAKCASYVHQGVGLLVVDVVTSRGGNLHNELVQLLDQPAEFQQPASAALYATAYRPVRRSERDWIEVWPAELKIGKALPELPLWIGPDLVVPVNLESTYAAACQRRRLSP